MGAQILNISPLGYGWNGAGQGHREPAQDDDSQSGAEDAPSGRSYRAPTADEEAGAHYQPSRSEPCLAYGAPARNCASRQKAGVTIRVSTGLSLTSAALKQRIAHVQWTPPDCNFRKLEMSDLVRGHNGPAKPIDANASVR
ncbi:MAG: hypothetical protein R3E02_09425 [Blastomonas sp.]